ncbi:hypothetical protein Tco_0685634 [Tanacetum coccineum]
MAGYWSVNGVYEVADEDESLIGMKTSYNLTFGDKCHVFGGRNEAGKWSAEEFTWIHHEYMDLEAHDDVCAQLPYALLGNQKWNLPVNYGIVIHSKRPEGIGENDRVIPRVAAYWSVDTSYPVADGFGKMVGMKRLYIMVFGDIARCVRGRTARGLDIRRVYLYGQNGWELLHHCSLLYE